MKNRFIVNSILLSAILLICFIVFDYINLPNAFGINLSNLNLDFWLGILNVSVVLLLYYLTYKTLDERTQQREKNKKDISLLLISECYRECLSNVENLNQEIVEKYIVPKIDFNSTQNENKIVVNLQNTPFLNENIILDLVKDGQMEKRHIEGYLKVKRAFEDYIHIRIIFFDSVQHYELLRIQLCEMIDEEIEKLKH